MKGPNEKRSLTSFPVTFGSSIESSPPLKQFLWSVLSIRGIIWPVFERTMWWKLLEECCVAISAASEWSQRPRVASQARMEGSAAAGGGVPCPALLWTPAPPYSPSKVPVPEAHTAFSKQYCLVGWDNPVDQNENGSRHFSKRITQESLWILNFPSKSVFYVCSPPLFPSAHPSVSCCYSVTKLYPTLVLPHRL